MSLEEQFKKIMGKLFYFYEYLVSQDLFLGIVLADIFPTERKPHNLYMQKRMFLAKLPQRNLSISYPPLQHLDIISRNKQVRGVN